MSRDDYHGLHQDEANRLRTIKRQEDKVRSIERARHAKNIAALCPMHTVVDPTGFGDGCLIDLAPYPAPIHPEAA